MYLPSCPRKAPQTYFQALSQVLYFYKLFGTLEYQLKPSQCWSFIQEILSTPKKSWGDPYPHLFILEVQDQTIGTIRTLKSWETQFKKNLVLGCCYFHSGLFVAFLHAACDQIKIDPTKMQQKKIENKARNVIEWIF